MASHVPRLRILSVGGNAVSAFLSWRLQATNACDVTVVWKSGFESVAQYGISFRSARFGNERFKPRSVVPSPDEAARQTKGSFDYVLLCVKALPDVYDIASIIESVVTPQHTCILINTTYSLGVESFLEERFPKNVVLSLVSQTDIAQLGPTEFEHRGSTDLWVGPANWNPEIPVSIQADMAEALAMTLGSGQVECRVSKNIQQQQFERMVGPIAFYTTSVIFETPNHADLLGLTGVRALISDTIDEVLRIAEARGCMFPADFKERTMEDMIRPRETNSVMYQDYVSHRPMEVETYLGSPIKIAQHCGVRVPRIETLYAMLHHVNLANQRRPAPATESSPTSAAPPVIPRSNPTPTGRLPVANGPYQSSARSQAPLPNPPTGSSSVLPPTGVPRQQIGSVSGREGRAPSQGNVPQMRRGQSGPGPNGMPPGATNGMMPPRGQSLVQKHPSFEGNGLDEFSHLVLYDNAPEGYVEQAGGTFVEAGGAFPQDLALRERELVLKQKELALRERELSLRGGRMGPGMGPGARPGPGPGHGHGHGPMQRSGPPRGSVFDDEDDDAAEFFDPNAYRGPPVDPDNVDMMSITSRRTRKRPSGGQLRHNSEMEDGSRRNNPFVRGPPGRSRGPAPMNGMQSIPNAHDSIMNNPLFGYSSDRYGTVDRNTLGRESRTNSLTAARLNELSGTGYGGYPSMNRRSSQSPSEQFGPAGRGLGRPPPIQHRFPSNGPSPISMTSGMAIPEVRQPTPRHPPGHGNSVAPHQVEQRAGVSNLYPPKAAPQVRSLTGSASASAGSGDSGRSAHIDSETSAFSSQSSLGPRAPIGVR